ncbi:MAG TPA: filamentous hemagglutinin family protein, partial [Bradyrhizobium sp.]|nr:filamentous hemagglutinin family protein [Bradyrhizobium sp.]
MARLAGVSVVTLLAVSPSVHARPLFGGANASSAVNSTINSTISSAQQAAAAAQSMNSLSRATQAVMSMQALQNAAHTAAQSAPGTVPNGLAPGGLQVAPGVGTDPSLWQNASLPTQSTSGGQTTVTIQQTAPQAILNWQTFNVGTNTNVYFNQSAGNSSGGNNWVALNRVLDPSDSPSQILGQIKAEGSVYLINQNGIIFGGSSQVNVGSLIASTLGITDSQFLAGIVNQQTYTFNGSSATINAPSFSSANNSTTIGLQTPGDVVVDAGAVIQTTAPSSVTTGGGYVYMFGANVVNNGTIITPDGQTVLAAAGLPTTVILPVGSTGIPGSTLTLNSPRTAPEAYTLPSDVYLTASSDPNIRGVTVLMDNGGTATNSGLILAPTGNITMTGMNVQQSGVLAATTSVGEAGSITLFAGSGGAQYAGTAINNAGLVIQATATAGTYAVYAAQTGTVTLTNGSVTTVLPEEDGQTAMDTQSQPQSVVSIEGQNVNLLGGSLVYAPSGQVSLEASASGQSLYGYDHPGTVNILNVPDASRVWVDDGAVVDVSGLQDVPVPAADDAVDVDVRDNELRDSPLQRGGVLESQDVWVNLNDLDVVVPGQQVYTEGGLIELSGWLGLIERPIDQRLTTGGSVTLFSTGDAILRPGSIVNIAGGSLEHQAGYVPTTWLVGADGHVYNINTAPADLPYVSVGVNFTIDHSHWGVTDIWANPFFPALMYQGAYLEGESAGSLNIVADRSEVDAQVYATAVNGPYQRSAGSLPASGSLNIGETVGGNLFDPTAVVIGPSDPVLDLADDTSPLPAEWQQTVFLSAPLLDSAGYGSITITAGNGATDPVTGVASPGISVTGGAALQVAAGGSITLNTTGGINVDGALVAHAGSITLNTTLGTKALTAATPLHDIVLDPGSLIDTSGLWVNDFTARDETTPTLYNGGNVTLQAYDNVWIDSGAVIDASSGGWLQSNGQFKTSSNGLPVGTGGNITLVSDYDALTAQGSSTVAQTYPDAVHLDGTLESYGFTAGGQLSLTTADIQIGGSAIIPVTQIGGTTFDPSQVLWLDPSFFASGGFSQYALYSYQSTLIAAGTDIELHAINFVPSAAMHFAPTGTDIASIAVVGTPPAYQRPGPVNLILSATDAFNGNLVMQPGAIINANPLATVALHARHQLTIDGTIDAPAGTIDLDLTGSVGPAGPPGTGVVFDAPYYDPTQTLWIGADAQLLAPGLVENVLNAQFIPTAITLDGGSVNIDQDQPPVSYYPYVEDKPTIDQPLGAVVAQAGAVIDVAGASGTVLIAGTSGLHGTLTPETIGTNGGTVAVTAAMGLMLDATMMAKGGSADAAGGTLSIDQDVGAYTASTGNSTFVQPVYLLDVSQTDPMMSAGLQLGQAVPAADAGEMFIGADQIMRSGFGSASLGAIDAIVFNGTVSLSLPNSLTINAANVADGTVVPLAQGTGPAINDGTVIAPAAGATVTLAAPYVDIGAGQRSTTDYYVSFGGGLTQATPPSAGATAASGTAELDIDADLIDIEGLLRSGATYSYTYAGSTTTTNQVSLPGFQSMSFNSSGDIRAVPSSVGSSLLATQGNLNFTATEIYPVTSAPVANANPTDTSSLFVIQATGANSVINFASNGEMPYVPLSAGGDLQIVAPTINQGGVLLAPMGQITFGNSSTSGTQAININLLPGSITSVSADGTIIPYGSPDGDAAWTYGAGGTYTLTAPPAKSISFYGQNVTVSGASGSSPAAVIDESGGGDLSGAQFVSGSGGSIDTLDGTNTFAILPSLGNHYAPRDPDMWSSNPTSSSAPPVNLQVGDQVYLTGIPGLPAGYYTLLPGHYALLPGAYKLTVDVGQVMGTGVTNAELPDGSYQVLGYQSVANTTIQNALPSLFTVTPGNVVRNESQYNESTVSQFFAAQATTNNTAAPYLPQDAGRLLIDITSTAGSLTFEGLDNFSTPPDGRGGQADIVASNLDILGPGDVAPAGYVGIQASQLDNIDAQSLLIGGTRSLSGNTLTITPVSQNVTVDQGAVLTGPEIMLTAKTDVTIASGAQIDTTGYGAIPNQFPSDPTTGQNLGTIAVSGSSSALVIASNAIVLPVTQTTGTSTLTIDAGADLFAADTLFLGANTINFDPTARFAGETVTVQTPIINLGTGATSGLTLTDALLAALSQGDPGRGLPATTDLVLNATQAFNVYGSADLGEVDAATGQPVLGMLTLSTPAINGFGGSSDSVTITAGNVTLDGTCIAATCSGSGTGQGTFTIDAAQITLGGGGTLPFNGFNTVTLAATGEVVGGASFVTGSSSRTVNNEIYAPGQVIPGVFSVTGNLVIAAPLITGQPGAITQLSATDAITFAPSAITTPAIPVASDGATLTVTAQTITQDTDISLPSGVISFTAPNGITLGAGSYTGVAGAVTPFFDVVQIAPAGTITLQTENGNVDIAAGATVDVSGGSLASYISATTPSYVDMVDSDAGGDGGTLNIIAPGGTATIAGNLLGGAVAGYTGGKAILNLGSGDAAALLSSIAGFSGEQSLTLASLANGATTVTIGNVTTQDFELSIATGNIDVVGTINASGANGGTISLNAGNNLTLESTAVLDAEATSPTGSVGNVYLGIAGNSTGNITLANGATINVFAAYPAGTSSTAATIGTGDQTFVTQPNAGYLYGEPVTVTDANDPAGSMTGTITSYDASSGTLTVDVTATSANSAGVQGDSWNISSIRPGGQVWLSAPRDGDTGIHITNSGLTVIGASSLNVEGVAVYDISSAPYVDQWLTTSSAPVIDATNYMNNAAAIEQSLGGLASIPGFQLLPGIELDSSGNITLLSSPSNSNSNPSVPVDGDSANSVVSPYIYSDGIDLGGLRFDGAPGVLTLRAAGNLVINGSLSDGFSAPVTSPDGPIFAVSPLAGGPSWSLNLIAGANLAAADPLALIPSFTIPTFGTSTTATIDPSGSIIFNEPYLKDQNGWFLPGVLRTGTGNLSLAAAGNIDIETPFGIYTAGEPSVDPTGFTDPTRTYVFSDTTFEFDSYLGCNTDNFFSCDSFDTTYPAALYPSYPVNGGNLSVTVEGSVIGEKTTGVFNSANAGTNYTATEPFAYWLWTEPYAASPTWFINFGTFYQTGPTTQAQADCCGDMYPTVAAFLGLGALGGGNVNVNVGGDMTNVDVALPTTGRVNGAGNLVTTGGGNLALNVGNSLDNSNLYVGQGAANISAGDMGLTQNPTGIPPVGTAQRVQLLIGDADFTVDAMRTANILIGDATDAETGLDPLSNSIGTGSGHYMPPGLEGYVAFWPGATNPGQFALFATMSAESALDITSDGGNITMNGEFAPPVLNITAASGSISSESGGYLAQIGGYLISIPSQSAELNLLAGQNITDFGVSMTAANFSGQIATTSDGPTGYSYEGSIFDPGVVPAFNPLYPSIIIGQPSDLILFDDPHTVHVYAVDGSLTNVIVGTAERASIRAGLDIVKPLFDIENTAASDVSLVEAGRDITSCLPCTSQTTDAFNIRVEGPGTLEVEAGRNILVQTGEFNTQGIGIESVGNADNPINLPATGATIDTSVGIGKNGPDIADFITAYIDPATDGAVAQTYTGQLVSYMDQLEGASLSPGQALADFRKLSPAQQMPFIDQVYFEEINAGGESYANTGVGYDRSYQAIETLFPGSVIGGTTTAYSGSLSLYQNARIRTEQGGDINVLAPGGSVTLGLENQTPNLAGQTDTARPGLLTLEGGDINIFSDQSVVVAQSRIFTELGGDIDIWSTNGDINAGKGKQTSIVTSPPNILYDKYGNVTKTPDTPQTGAGIATLIGVPGVPPGNVNLFAPHGTVDAGEAG